MKKLLEELGFIQVSGTLYQFPEPAEDPFWIDVKNFKDGKDLVHAILEVGRTQTEDKIKRALGLHV